jgi:hypothetical protein
LDASIRFVSATFELSVRSTWSLSLTNLSIDIDLSTLI